MCQIVNSLDIPAPTARRAQELFVNQQQEIYRKTDRLLAGLMVLQWLAGIVVALWISPYTWIGQYSQIHLHVWAALFLGGAITIFPVALAVLRPGETLTRYTIAAAQMLMSALLIHLSGGRMETHFHIFGSLAALAFYRDWRVLIPATAVITIDHFIRGVYFPQSVYGVLIANPWRSIEHTAWVVFEGIFLFILCVRSIREMRAIALNTAQLETTNQVIEEKVVQRTAELRHAQEALQKAHDEMEHRVVLRTAELARTNEELRLQKTILESQGEASIDGILVVSREGRMVSYNRRFNEIWGIPPAVTASGSEEAALQTALEKLQDPEAFLSKITYLYQHPDEKSQEEILLKDGRTLDRYSAPVKGEDGVNYGRIWFFRDITERKQFETTIHQAKNEAERANRAKSEFLSRMSHELRTPLNAILGFAQVMKMRDLGPRENEAVGHIHKAGRHLLDLINEVLDISRIEAGNLSLSPEPIPVAHTVGEALNLVRPLATAEQIKFINEMTICSELHVLADQQRLKQVLLNLLSNAVKYNRRGGAVTLTCEQVSDAALRVLVSDTGHGLRPEEIEKLFVPFERLGAARSQIEGTGIGLALSKHLIEAMNGSIGVSSTPGEGSTFWIELPLAEAPLARQKRMMPAGQLLTDISSAEEEAAGRTVLYIEDNLSNLKLLEYMLTDRPDVRLLSAMQGSVGLDLASRHNPDLILLDLHLPDILGDEVLRRLRSDPQTERIPVVMVSADATRKEIDRLLAAGARDYLTKPLDVGHCLRILEETCSAEDRVACGGDW